MKPISFSQRLKSGWNKEQLMKYYALSESQYQKILASLQEISKNTQSKEVE